MWCVHVYVCSCAYDCGVRICEYAVVCIVCVVCCMYSVRFLNVYH